MVNHKTIWKHAHRSYAPTCLTYDETEKLKDEWEKPWDRSVIPKDAIMGGM